jgi:ABC-2 type transport system ATP-binding protein
VSVQGGRTFLKVADEAGVEAVLALVRERRGRVHSLIPRVQTLEDIFVEAVRQS